MLNEDPIEMAFIDQLSGQGFEFHNGPDIAPDSDNPQRKNFFEHLISFTFFDGSNEKQFTV